MKPIPKTLALTARVALAAYQPVVLPPVTLGEALDCPRRPGTGARG